MPPIIILHVDEEGTILRLEEEGTEQTLSYRIQVSGGCVPGGAPDEAPLDTYPRVSTHLVSLDTPGLLGTMQAVSGVSEQAQRFVPFPNHSDLPWMRFPRGVAYCMAPDAVPCKDTDVPFNSDFASGISIVEIVPREAAYALADQYFTSSGPGNAAFHDESFIARLVEPPSEAKWNDPGVCDDCMMVDALQHYSSEFVHQDPFLEPFHPDFAEAWWPVLRRDDSNFVGVFKSDWRTVPADVRQRHSGHGQPGSDRDGESVHYYLVCRYSLPRAIADQVLHLVITNPRRRTWAEWAKSPELLRAEALSRHAREHILRRSMAEMQVCPHSTNGAFVHSTSSVLRLKEVTGTGGRGSAVFGSGLVSTLDANGGVVTSVGSDPRRGLLWWFGTPNNRLGGGAWRSVETASLFPERCNERLDETTLEQISKTGYVPQWGFVKMSQVAIVKGDVCL